jgi:hypothetical protein
MSRWVENLNDGMFSAEGGMNSGISPSLIQSNQTYTNVNSTNRGGFWRSRPKFMKRQINFGGSVDIETWFKNYAISGQTYFSAPSGQSLLACCVGGRVFSFSLNNDNSFNISEFTPPGNRNSLNQPITWFCQAATYLIAQNGLDTPIIFDGSNGRRANQAASEVPTGRQMAYINNRLFIVDNTQREILPGDLAYQTATSVLQFIEISDSAASGGQPLSIPLEAGGIKGIIPTAQLDTQAGQGTLLVATEKAVTSINAIVQRSLWPTIQLQNIALVGNGFSTNGLAIVNGDVWGRSSDGYRSFIMARREFGAWGNTPQSEEVQRFLDYDDLTLLEFSSSVYFDNRLLMTVNPKAYQGGAYHNGIIALNFDNISSLAGKSSPSYDGLWSGIKPYGFCTGNFNGKQRCFAFCYSETGNELWEITTEYGDDNDTTRIEWVVETRSFTCDHPMIKKAIDSVEVYVDNVWGQVDFELMYKPDQYPCWLPYTTWSECAAKSDCDVQGYLNGVCQQPLHGEPQYRARMNAGKPPVTFDSVQGTSQNIAYEFQLRLRMIGHARLRALRLLANLRDETTKEIK